ncbi:MAG TPA: hypothetical protein VGE52_17655, partial [Pirellulales bacterium]
MHRNDRAAEGTGAAQTASVPSGNQRRVSPRRDWGRFYVVGGFSLSALVHLSTLLLLVAVAVRHHERGAGEGVSLRAAYSQSEGDGLDLDSVEFGMELPESAREESLTPLLAENDPAQEPTEAVENAEDEVDALTASVNAPIVGPDTISASTLVMTTSMLESQPLTATVPLPPSEAISMEMNASHVPPSGRAPTGQDLARAKATFFGSTAQGLRFVFVVDCS